MILDPNDPEQVYALAEVICDREFGAPEDRWKRTLERAQAGGDYSAATVNRLLQTAQVGIATLIRLEAARKTADHVEQKDPPK